MAAVMLIDTGCGKKEAWTGNILVITLDTTRADHIGCYGYQKGDTPNIDRLAAGGLRFENCYSSIPLTLPSHANIFTGRNTIAHGVRNNGTYVLSEEEKTLAEYLTEQGYNTYAAIAAFVLQSKFGLDQGFRVYDDTIESDTLHKTMKSEVYADEIYGKFDRWLDENAGSRFFAWVHFYDPHTPYLPHSNDLVKTEKHDLVPFYDGEITFMDQYIGKIMERLEEKGIADDTLVVLVGDHGEAFGEHDEFASHMVFCYEANLRVPLIFYNQKLFSESKVIPQRVSTIDLMPTVLDLAGLKKGEDIQGESLLDLMEGEGSGGDRRVYIESMYGKEEFNWAPLTGIIDGDYKFISLPKQELYNIKKDPLEKDNLFLKKGRLLREMEKKLQETILKFSGRGDSRRELGKEDMEHLKSLGYISSYGGKGEKVIDPKDGIVLNVRLKEISARIEKGDLDEMEKELLKIKQTELGGDNFLVYDFLYRIYMKKRNFSDVMKTLTEAIRVLPKATPFRLNYIVRLGELGRYNEVITQCDELLKIDPLFTRAYIILGETWEILGNKDKSAQYFRKALELEPENISLQIKFSEKLLGEGKFKEVLTVYDTLLGFDAVKQNTDLLYKIALFNTKYGSMEKSGQLLAGLVRQNPSGKYYYFYAMVLARLGDRVNALKNMETALTTYGDDLTSEQKDTARRAIEAMK